MKWYQWIFLILVVYVLLTGAFLYGTSKDVWNAGNSCYIPETK